MTPSRANRFPAPQWPLGLHQPQRPGRLSWPLWGVRVCTVGIGTVDGEVIGFESGSMLLASVLLSAGLLLFWFHRVL